MAKDSRANKSQNCSPLVFWGHNTLFAAGLIGMVSLEFRLLLIIDSSAPATLVLVGLALSLVDRLISRIAFL